MGSIEIHFLSSTKVSFAEFIRDGMLSSGKCSTFDHIFPNSNRILYKYFRLYAIKRYFSRLYSVSGVIIIIVSKTDDVFTEDYPT